MKQEFSLTPALRTKVEFIVKEHLKDRKDPASLTVCTSHSFRKLGKDRTITVKWVWVLGACGQNWTGDLLKCLLSPLPAHE